MHNRATVEPQFFHTPFGFSSSSQPLFTTSVNHCTAAAIDSRSARFSTTAKFIKL
jgi:hypothetical protein